MQALGPWANNVSSWVSGARNLISSFAGHSRNVTRCASVEKPQTEERRALEDDSSFQVGSIFVFYVEICLLNYSRHSLVTFPELCSKQAFKGVNFEHPLDLISNDALQRLSDDIQVLIDFTSAKPTSWNTSYSSWGNFGLDSTLPCSPG